MTDMLRSDASDWSRAGRDPSAKGQAEVDPPDGGSGVPRGDIRAYEQGAPLALARMVESEIIPRLLVNCRTASPLEACGNPNWVRPDRKDVDMLASSAIREDASQLLAQVESQLARGISPESMMLDVLAPAARLLGEWWEQDACDFMEVTMGLWRLQEVVHEISGRIGALPTWGNNCRTALFATMPGDDHAFGSLVVEEMFRKAGWDSHGMRGHRRDELLDAVAARHFDLLALTASTDVAVEVMGSLVSDMRGASRNTGLLVVVGGSMFHKDADLVVRVGADGTAADGRSAVAMADALMNDRMAYSASAVGFG